MLTPEQQKWIDHLRDDDHIVMKTYDPSCVAKFDRIKARIITTLGNQVRVEHRGATGLGISGQDEIDVYIPVPPEKFDQLLTPLENAFGKPRSVYPLERARFVTEEGEKHIDIFLINDTHSGWLDGIKFEDYLINHPEALEEYRKLKEAGNGLSTREYYRRKIEFINDILVRAMNK